MSKLIYVDRLKKDILSLQDCYNGFSDTYDKACIIGVIDEQPTIEERKSGKWEETDDGWDGTYYVCSECGCPWTLIDGTPKDNGMNFCPNCGADMRGGNNETIENTD